MRTLGVLVVLLIIVVIVTGFYLGWFHVSSANNGNKSHVTMTVNQAKIRADKNKAVSDLHNLKPAATMPVPTTAPDNAAQ